MRKHDVWIIVLLLTLLGAACLPLGHSDIPDKAEVVPPPRPVTPSPTPSPTPEKLPQDFMIEDLRREIEELHAQLEDYITQPCDCPCAETPGNFNMEFDFD